MALRLYRTTAWQVLAILLVVFGVVVPSILLLVTFNEDSSRTAGESFRSPSPHERKPLDYPADPHEASELRQQIRELENIRSSVRDELRVLEQQRSKLGADIEANKESLGRLKRDVTAAKNDLQDKRGKLSKVNREFYEKVDPIIPTAVNQAPIIVLPAQNKMSSRSELSEGNKDLLAQDGALFTHCTFESCFNVAKCPLTRPFTVFLYNEVDPYIFPVNHYGDVISEFADYLRASGSLTSKPERACLFVAVLEHSDEEEEGRGGGGGLQNRLSSLPHWEEEGANHLLIELSSIKISSSLLDGISTGRAIISRSHLSPTRPFRPEFDILIPSLFSRDIGWRDLVPLLPIARDNLLYFHGEYTRTKHISQNVLTTGDIGSLRDALSGKESIDIELECSKTDSGGGEGKWTLCGEQSSRLERCSRSLFSLVPGLSKICDTGLYTRLLESLVCGSIPVVVGTGKLPFDEVIDWTRVAILIPTGRFSDIHYILRSVSRDDIQNFRLCGRNLWHTYFSSPLAVVKTTVAVVRSRTLHPPPLSPEFTGISLFTRQTSKHRRISSPLHSHNFTIYSTELWNTLPGPFFTYPFTPFKSGPLSGSQYSELDERGIARLPLHIVDGAGITGPNFEDILLGNTPEEQFTVVMLTYQRNKVLVEALMRLEEVSFLNKVVVVWNNEEVPPDNIEWPDIGVPVEVVRGRGNSLNNRFLPFKEIETEAVLSIDDDVHLRADEIQFAFRVWREARDRIVGFPGRFHAYDLKHKSWLYNSNYSCELSMVLTGAAFFHKIYSYLYTYWQPKEVLSMVDQYMNCEDIAMNFLVSHITRKPPLKVTSRWTFRCPGCPDTLSTDDTHFKERHICMNTLTRLYGYIPLIYTQFRIDSVLFKTRLPSNLQKCYQFI